MDAQKTQRVEDNRQPDSHAGQRRGGKHERAEAPLRRRELNLTVHGSAHDQDREQNHSGAKTGDADESRKRRQLNAQRRDVFVVFGRGARGLAGFGAVADFRDAHRPIAFADNRPAQQAVGGIRAAIRSIRRHTLAAFRDRLGLAGHARFVDAEID